MQESNSEINKWLVQGFVFKIYLLFIIIVTSIIQLYTYLMLQEILKLNLCLNTLQIIFGHPVISLH